jgi:hypothetical protein
MTAPRAVLDAYWTPRSVALRCTRWLAAQGYRPGSIVEPSVGGGAWVIAARQVWPGAVVDRVDVDASAPGLHVEWREGDSRWPGIAWQTLETGRWDLALGNPPYDEVEAHVGACLRRARVTALLLRETITGGQARYEALWSQHQPAWVAKLPDRPQWEGGNPHASGDTTGSVLIVWDRAHIGPTRWDWIPVGEEQGRMFGGVP